MTKKDYEVPGITVHWDSARCIHTGVCLRALPGVFDVTRRPWIDLTQASVQEIADAVCACPTGALRFSSDEVDEPVESTTVLRPVRGGPMVVRGVLEVVDGAGHTIDAGTRMTLCRCGNSANQPFCDNSHRTAGFDEPEPSGPVAATAPDEVCPPQEGFSS